MFYAYVIIMSNDWLYLVSYIAAFYYQHLQLLYILVNKIKQNREVTINIPDETHGSDIIRIEGNKQGVDEAKSVRFSCYAFCPMQLFA